MLWCIVLLCSTLCVSAVAASGIKWHLYTMRLVARVSTDDHMMKYSQRSKAVEVQASSGVVTLQQGA
jgi:hypothetical protein